MPITSKNLLHLWQSCATSNCADNLSTIQLWRTHYFCYIHGQLQIAVTVHQEKPKTNRSTAFGEHSCVQLFVAPCQKGQRHISYDHLWSVCICVCVLVMYGACDCVPGQKGQGYKPYQHTCWPRKNCIDRQERGLAVPRTPPAPPYTFNTRTYSCKRS